MRKVLRIVLGIASVIAVPIFIDFFVFGNAFPSNIDNQAWAGFLGSYLGGIATLVAVFITISDNNKKIEIQRQSEKEQLAEQKKYADSIASRPGASEHQTGLTLDIFSKDNSNKNTFKDTEVFKWLKDNSYKFGFILRYPEDKVKVTGYGYESWHYRYVGKKIAKYIYENNITFEEYYAYFIEK